MRHHAVQKKPTTLVSPQYQGTKCLHPRPGFPKRSCNFPHKGELMITSRRGFLRSLGARPAAGMAMPWALMGTLRAATVEPYRTKQDDGFIRLNCNENAYGPSTKVAEVIRSSIGSAHRYPRMQYDWLVERIAGVDNVRQEQVLLGCGSSEILRVAAFAFLGNGKQLIQASPTFEAMERYAHAAG